jgi:hypothetical protein
MTPGEANAAFHPCFADNNKRDAALKGAYELRHARIVVGWTLSKKPITPHVFQIVLPSRVYYFAVKSQDELQEWIVPFERTLAALQQRPVDETLIPRSPNDYYDGSESQQHMTENEYYGAYANEYNNGGQDEYGDGGNGTVDNYMFPSTESAPPRDYSYESPMSLPVSPTRANEVVTFYVVTSDPVDGLEKRYTMQALGGKFPTLSMAKLKRQLAGPTKQNPEHMTLYVEGTDLLLDDAWTAADIKLSNEATLRLKVTVPPPVIAPPRVAEPVPTQTAEPESTADIVSAMGISPPAPPSRKPAAKSGSVRRTDDALHVVSANASKPASAPTRGWLCRSRHRSRRFCCSDCFGFHSDVVGGTRRSAQTVDFSSGLRSR